LLFSGEIREILPSITEATNQRNIFESRHSYFSGSSHDISRTDLLLLSQKMLEVTHETTITVLDLSCHCQTNTEFRNPITYNPLEEKYGVICTHK
jgi:hypothetical protein